MFAVSVIQISGENEILVIESFTGVKRLRQILLPPPSSNERKRFTYVNTCARQPTQSWRSRKPLYYVYDQVDIDMMREKRVNYSKRIFFHTT